MNYQRAIKLIQTEIDDHLKTLDGVFAETLSNACAKVAKKIGQSND